MSNLLAEFQKLSAKSGMDAARVNILADRPPVECISTGSLAVDVAIGPYCPGFPKGQLSQVFGGEGSGKSLLMCMAMASAQREGLPVFLVDREVHYTPEWFERFGGDASKVIDLQPETIEQCIEMLNHILEAMEKTGQIGGLFVIDSLQALPTEKMYNADIETKDRLAASAGILSDRLPGLIDRIHRNKLAIVSVGQIRDTPDLYGKQYTPGGNALRHFTVLRLFMRYARAILEKIDGEEITKGFTSVIRVDKNNVGGRPKGWTTEVDFLLYGGADDTSALLEIAMQAGIVTRAGAWYKIEGTDIKFQGKNAWSEHCDEEIRDRIKAYAFDPNIQLKGTGFPGDDPVAASQGESEE